MEKNIEGNLRPIVTVGILIFSPSQRALFVKSHKWNDLFTVPGGKVELGEKCYDAAIREAKEETNLEIVNVQFALWQESIFSDQFWKKVHLVMHDYVAELKEGSSETDVHLNNEAEEYIWANPQEVAKLNLTKETHCLWNWALSNRGFK